MVKINTLLEQTADHHHRHNKDETITTEDQSGGGRQCLVGENSSRSYKLDDERQSLLVLNRSIAARETKVVFYLRLLLIIMLIASTIVTSVLIYIYTSESEQDVFEERFAGDATKVLEAIGGSLDLTLGALDTFVVETVSFAEYDDEVTTANNNNNNNNTDANNNTNNHNNNNKKGWPCVTLPDFAVRASKLRTVSKAFFLTQLQYVEADQRTKWEEYSITHDEWVQEGLEVQKEDTSFKGKRVHNNETLPYIHNSDLEPSPDDWEYYFPTWQGAPIVTTWPPYNWDYANYSPFQEALGQLMDDKDVVISKISNFVDPNNPDSITEVEHTNSWAKDYIGEDEDPSEPYVDIFYPILDIADDRVQQNYVQKQNSTFLGVLTISVYWRDLIKGILPSDSKGIDIVFDNDCNQTFTYEITGRETLFLGTGDHHDTKFDDLEIQSSLLDLGEFSTSRKSSYTGLPLSTRSCQYRLRLYPSIKMEEHYLTNKPWIYTTVVIVVFVFTSILFLVYDRFVERRQKKVMSEIYERTYKLENSHYQLEVANRKIKETSAAQLKHFACMSHEIRTPLNCIVGVSSVLQTTNLNPMQDDLLRMITSSGELLRTVVDDVLDYSKLESGNVDIVIEKCNLQKTLDVVIQAIDVKGRASDVSIRTDYDISVCEYIHTDSRRLQQILFNLLGNAVKFSKSGGVIDFCVSLSPTFPNEEETMSAAYAPERHESIPEFKPDHVGGIIRFEIMDYGKGIRKEDYEKIFDAFVQSSADTERLYGGTGLGLPITTKLIHRLGGTISVESEVEKWTKFTVDLPLEDEPVHKSSVASCLRKTNIVLVTEEERTAQHLSKACKQCNFSLTNHKSMDTFVKESSRPSKITDIFIIHEKLYADDKASSLLSKYDMTLKPVLVTYGTEFLHHESKLTCGHFRSIDQMLPSVIFNRISELMTGSTKQLLSSQAYSQNKSSSGMLKQEQPSTQNKCNSNNKICFGSLRVLIAEDNTVNQKVLKRILMQLGVKDIAIVENGKDAVDKEAEKIFDVCFMDVQMPIMDGIEACKLICQRQQNDGNHKKAKIIFATAQVSTSFEMVCRDAGGTGFIAKPYTIDDVEQSLFKHIVPCENIDKNNNKEVEEKDSF